MRIGRSGSGWLWGLLVVTALAAQTVEAQTTKMPSTLRYGSGYLDVPAASVLPHLAVTGTFSGFNASPSRTVIVNQQGDIVAFGPEASEWFFDGSVALGLFNRVEVGTTLQSFNASDAGGNMWGAFGRLAVLRPEREGLGLAGGVRYVTAPTYDDNVDYQPPRLGFPDQNFREEPFDLNTELTLYGVGSLMVQGLEANWLPDWDATFSVGYGTGMFSEGRQYEFYRYADSKGWFLGGAVHAQLGENSLLNIMGEWNGFDINLGAQLDFGGIRVGGHVLGANYWTDVGFYRTPKWGFLASACLDLAGPTFLCQPRLMERVPQVDTIRLPAPPPDTVIVERAPPLPTGTPATICLATGQDVQVLISAQGDTLVGPQRVSIATLRPGVVFAGTYAEGRDWFVADQPITFENLEYLKSGGEVGLECAQIMRVGEYQGVPLFALRTAERPFEMLYVPVRPGVWQGYQRGLPAVRG